MSGGGVSLLIIALVASIFLAVVPQNITNEYTNTDCVTRAAAEVIDGHEYAVLEDYNDTSTAIIDDFMSTNNYLKFILKEDLVYQNSNSTDPYFGPVFIWRAGGLGKDVILDFNGHTITTQPPVVGFEILAAHLRIEDSSAAGTGGVTVTFASYNRNGENLSVEIYGGTFDRVNLYSAIGGALPTTELVCTVYGGVVNQLTAIDLDTNANLSANTRLAVSGGRVGQVQPGITVPPYLNIAHDADGNVTAVTAYDAYCVSHSDLVTGRYNYAYGYAWEISAAELANLAVPDDKTYYLWARDKDGPYHYLDLRYVDGFLV